MHSHDQDSHDQDSHDQDGVGGDAPEAGPVVAIDAPGTDLGRRIAALASSDPTVAVVGPRSRLDLVDGDHLVVLAPGGGPEVDGTTVGGVGLTAALRILEHTTASRVVVLSTAMVHGARAGNPVPLDEDDPVRPNPGAAFPGAKVELERAAAALRERRPGTRVAVLRPPICTAGAGQRPWLERSAWHARTTLIRGEGRVAQFLHVEDLARAAEVCRRAGLDGVFDVAPDGWLTEDEQLALVGAGRPPRLGPAFGRWWSAVRWQVGRASTPPDLFPYVQHSWVVDNARLRAHGWEPVHTNEEAFVQGHRGGWWSSLTPDRRQAVSSAVTVAGSAAAVVLGALGVRRLVRGPSSGRRGGDAQRASAVVTESV